MRLGIGLLLVALLATPASSTLLSKPKSTRTTLNIYFIDVEGGAATLIVTPAGESVLIDAGWDGAGGRDPKRFRRQCSWPASPP
jgi:hypothetical protein